MTSLIRFHEKIKPFLSVAHVGKSSSIESNVTAMARETEEHPIMAYVDVVICDNSPVNEINLQHFDTDCMTETGSTPKRKHRQLRGRELAHASRVRNATFLRSSCCYLRTHLEMDENNDDAKYPPIA